MKNTENLEEFFRERDEKRFFVKKWIDKLFKDSLFGYRPSYIIFRPDVMVADAWIQIKWAWQRVFRGWDDRITWSIDSYLAENIPLWIEQLKKFKGGVPMSMYEDEYLVSPDISREAEDKAIKKYDDILDKIALGFRSYIEFDGYMEDKIKGKKLQDEFNEGFDLFRKYFDTLWD